MIPTMTQPMMPTMIPMKHFVLTILQEGGISAAAQKLYITQPALSIALKRLEEELGVVLFDRKQSPIALTEAGKAYVTALMETQRIQRELSSRLDDLKGLKTGGFSIGAAHFLTSFSLLRITHSFKQAYPGIAVSMSESTSQTLQTMLSKREIDLVVDYGFDAPEFERFPLKKERILLCLPKSNPVCRQYQAMALTRRDVLENRHLRAPAFPLQAVSREKFALMKKGNDMAWRSERLCRAAGFEPESLFDSDQLVTAYEAAVSGLVATFATDSIIRAIDDHDRLCYFALDGDATERTIYIARYAHQYFSEAARCFIRFAQSYMKTSDA